MGDYLDGQSRRGGQSVKQVNISQNIDINALAEAIAKKLPSMGRMGSGEVLEDNFNDEASLEKLAQSMTVQRGNSESNFEDLGKVKKTKKDEKKVSEIRELLSKLGD